MKNYLSIHKYLLGILSFGLIIRLVGLMYGHPYILNIDEPALVRSALGIRFSIWVDHFDWPHFNFYLHYVFYEIFIKFRGVLQVLNLRGSIESFAPIVWDDPFIFYLLSRFLNSILVVLSGIPLYMVSRKFAKKKYALISENGTLKIKGFESVRRNWSMIAKEAQEKVLEIILRDNNKDKALKFVKKIIDDLRNKKIPLDKVIIHTQLQKEISEYDSKGPHVAVAQRLKNQGVNVGPGSMIRFVVLQGSDIIRNRSKIPEEVRENDYDAYYYIHNQVVPAVERIFNVLGYKKDDLLETKDQTKLEGFF